MKHLFRSIALWVLLAVRLSAGEAPGVAVTAGKGSYAVVVSAATHGQAEWKAVVDALAAKHQATVIVHPKSVWEAKEALATAFPRHGPSASAARLPPASGQGCPYHHRRRAPSRRHRQLSAPARAHEVREGQVLPGPLQGHPDPVSTLLLLLSISSPLAGPDPVSLAPAAYRPAVAKALAAAGANVAELAGVLTSVKPEQREAAAFLIANMPPRDLTSLSKAYLVEHIELAFRAREELPWGRALPDELFLNYVVPYASINERRDRWRADFLERFLPVAKACKTPTEAVLRLNNEMFPALGVKYHARKRPKPDQSPYESIEAGYASCSGLSVLLIDACRAVAIPARFVGTPLWIDRKGNHSWVEVWDRQWMFVGAAEPGPLDKTWFVGKARQADPTKAEHRIYATSFERTKTWFPLVWDTKIKYVRADDVTAFYTARQTVTFQVVDRVGGKPVQADVTLRLGGRLVAKDTVEKPVAFVLAGGVTYDAEIAPSDGSPAVKRQVPVGDQDGQTIVLPLK